jgi:cellulose synthase (UDP-forming)
MTPPRSRVTESRKSSWPGAGGRRDGSAAAPVSVVGLTLITLAARAAVWMLGSSAVAAAATAPELLRGPVARPLVRLRDRAAPPRVATESPRGEVRHASESVLSQRQKLTHLSIALLWALVTATFWVWWLGHAGGGTPWLYWTQTATLVYQTTILPSFFWMYVRKMRRPIEVKAPPRMRVAMITLCVPSSESMEVIRKQLEALRRVDYPHDSWVLDEGDSTEVRTMAEACGVRYFSRRGVARWNQPEPPFQVATKAGNVNAWLDHVRAIDEDYEVFVQMDIDHLPRQDYLDRVLGYFTDPVVAWVQAPSVCGNLDSWAARGLAEQDLIFQGPLQMGFYGATETPFIIGSHTTYRTAAIREIGGFQPTRAEDHLDTVMLAAHGYRGVFVPELIAVGDGPHNFATYLRQQFAWAHSMIEIFLRRTPRLIRRYSFGQAVQFLFCQSWYTLWSVSLGLLWMLPAVALFAHRPIADVSVGEFLLYFLPVPLTSSLMWCSTRRWFQPDGVRLSWRGVILEIARWPVVLWALVNVVLRIKRDYMITPKGVAGQRGPSASSIYGPYIFLTALPLIALWYFHESAGGGGVQGYFGLALVNALLGLLLLKTTLVLEIRELASGPGIRAAVRMRAGVLTCALLLLGCLAASTIAAWTPMLGAIS